MIVLSKEQIEKMVDPDQMMELLLDRPQIVKNIRMIEFKVIEDQRARAVMDKLGSLIKKRAIVLIRFDHEERGFP